MLLASRWHVRQIHDRLCSLERKRKKVDELEARVLEMEELESPEPRLQREQLGFHLSRFHVQVTIKYD
jgi:hypothetical protein